MSLVNVQRVEQPSETLVDACATMYAALMKHDIALLNLSGGDVNLVYLFARAAICACAFDGEYYTATNADNEVLGFCLWMPPGKATFSTDEQRQLGFNDFIARLPETGKEFYMKTYMPEFPKFVVQCLDNPKWKADFWWLDVLMVRPENHKQDVGRALLQPVREKAAQALEPLALSTHAENNVPKYTRLGFRLLGNQIISSPWGEWSLYIFSLDPRTI